MNAPQHPPVSTVPPGRAAICCADPQEQKSTMSRFAAFALLCVLSVLPVDAQVPADPPPKQAPAPVVDREYDACVANRLKPQAAARGIPAEAFDRFMAGVTADRSVLDLLDAQPEFTTPIWDYLAGL